MLESYCRCIALRRASPLRRRRRRKPSSCTSPRGSTRPRTRRSTSWSRSSSKKTGVKVELSRYAPQEMIPKTVAALDSGTPPDVVYGDVFDFQVAGKWAFEGRLEDLSDILDADEGQVPAEHARNHLHVQRQGQEARLLRLPGQAPDHAHPVLEGHAGRGGLQGVRHPEGPGRRYFDFWCGKVQEGYRKKTGKRVYSVGSPMGVDSSRLVLLVPHLHGRATTSSW